ncbi:asparagine synthase-related protein [Streptomyces sp. NPDC048718]|uniref:asparagine synthase-related protein n=1 Tax=Streptomyces sp. NPDC048718 TaxID=3365587 RepID=UPI003711E1B8
MATSSGERLQHARIFGSFGTPVRSDDLAAAAGRQRHGGTPGTGLLRGDRWALGSNRLAAGDIAADFRPYRLPSVPGVVAVLDGEIYNHRELRRRLRDRGYAVPEAGSGALLPALYATYGPDFAAHLDGMFSVAVVDTRGAGRLVLATDGQGAKTLYHHRASDGAVHFASELPGLLAFSRVPTEPRELVLDECLSVGSPPGGRTPLQGVGALSHGAVAVATGTGGWCVRKETEGKEGATALRQEVRRVLPADGAVCVIDSQEGATGHLATTAAGYLAELDRPPLHTFQLVRRTGRRSPASPGRGADRRARIVRHQVVIDAGALADLLPRTIWHLGGPDADPAAVETYLLLRAARRADFDVALAERGTPQEPRVGVPTRLRESLYTPEYRHYVRAHAASDLPPADDDLRRLDHLGAAWGVQVRVPRRGSDEERLSPAPPAPVPLLTRDSPLTALAHDVLAPGALTQDGRLDRRAVAALVTTQHRTPTPEGTRAVLALLSHELWLQELRALRPMAPPNALPGAGLVA